VRRRTAALSQESSRVWIGWLRRGQWTVAGKGRVYDLPRTKKRGDKRDQSIHIFRIG
jgi:hypothetical protein